MESEGQLRWGIMGCANIARKVARAISLSGSSIHAVASRSIEKADNFLSQNKIDPSTTKTYGSYEDLINDSSIQAIYVPLPTTMHVEWVIRVVEAGKHCLCEKPVALSVDQFSTIIAACNSMKVIFWDGVMFMHHKRLSLLRDTIADPFFGVVTRVSSSFSFHGSQQFLDTNIRTSASGDPLGALGDLGWYCIRIALIAFSQGTDLKTTNLPRPRCCIAACTRWTDSGVPLECDARVAFGDDAQGGGKWSKQLVFDCSFLTPFRQRVEICANSAIQGVGDKVISCDDFVIPRRPSTAAFTLESFAPDPLGDLATRVYVNSETKETNGCEQEVEMIRAFGSLVGRFEAAKGDTPSSGALQQVTDEILYWQNVSLLTQAVVDAVMESMRGHGAEVDIKTPFLP